MRRIVTSAAVTLAVLVGACDHEAATAPEHAVAAQSAASGPAAPGHGGNAPNILMLDDCSTADPAYDGLGGCPETTHPSAQSFRGDVPLAEVFELLFSPLAPNDQVIGHPSWRNQPSYLSVRAGRSVRVTNRGGRVHTLTEVADFGGGFIPDLNGALIATPECGDNFVPAAGVEFVEPGQTQLLEGLDPGLHKFQCCIHPWMRAAIRAE